MKTIALTRGLHTVVDDDVYEWAREHKWYAQRGGRIFYAARKISLPDGKQKLRFLHREILEAPSGAEVDHRDGNGLNNMKENIRICSRSENMRNRRKYTNNTSGFKGVTWFKRDSKWRARIRIVSRQTHLGYFDTAEEAARAWDKAAIRHYGEFAVLNFESGKANYYSLSS